MTIRKCLKNYFFFENKISVNLQIWSIQYFIFKLKSLATAFCKCHMTNWVIDYGRGMGESGKNYLVFVLIYTITYLKNIWKLGTWNLFIIVSVSSIVAHFFFWKGIYYLFLSFSSLFTKQKPLSPLFTKSCKLKLLLLQNILSNTVWLALFKTKIA